MKIDLNNQHEVKRLRNAAKTDNGLLILSLLEDKLSTLDYDKIDIEQDNEKVGAEFKATRKARQVISDTITFLRN